MAYNQIKVSAFDKISQNREDLVSKIIEQMNNGKIFWRAGWNREIMKPHNPASSSLCYYKGGNRMKLIFDSTINGYKDPRWCTFKQAQEEGWNIKKGESGVLLEKWIFTKTEKDGDSIDREVKLDKPRVNFFYVFNAEQIEGIPEFNLMETPSTDLSSLAQNIIESSECVIQEIAQSKAYYSPSKDKIVLPPREAFKNINNFIATTLHEMSHSTGHPSRMNRKMLTEFGTEDYAKEELRAELGSVFMQAELGIEIEPEMLENHAGYLQSFMKTCSNDYNEFFRACKDAQDISERLISNYEHILQKVAEMSNLKTANLNKTDLHSLCGDRKSLNNINKRKETTIAKKTNITLEK